MKSAGNHPNSHAREIAMQALYQLDVAHHPVKHVLALGWLNQRPDPEKEQYCLDLIKGVVDNQDALDEVIRSMSDKHITQISIVTICILRIAVFELMRAELDAKIIIDDLLNLTRKYDGDESVPFANGILDRFERERRADQARLG